MKGIFPRVTNPSAARPEGLDRLACVRPAASVRSEPGSNSQVERFDSGFFGLEVNPSILRNGHLHIMTLLQFPEVTSR